MSQDPKTSPGQECKSIWGDRIQASQTIPIWAYVLNNKRVCTVHNTKCELYLDRELTDDCRTSLARAPGQWTRHAHKMLPMPTSETQTYRNVRFMLGWNCGYGTKYIWWCFICWCVRSPFRRMLLSVDVCPMSVKNIGTIGSITIFCKANSFKSCHQWAMRAACSYECSRAWTLEASDLWDIVDNLVVAKSW